MSHEKLTRLYMK